MANVLKQWVQSGRLLMVVLVIWIGVFPGAISGRASESSDTAAILPSVSDKHGFKPEDFIGPFDSLRQRQNMPPEIAGLMQGIMEVMAGAAKGQDPQTLKGKSRDLLQGFRPFMERSDLPPEMAGILKSFQSLMQKAPNDLMAK